MLSDHAKMHNIEQNEISFKSSIAEKIKEKYVKIFSIPTHKSVIYPFLRSMSIMPIP